MDKTHKVCFRCKEELPVGMFTIARRNKDGLQSYCKPCQRAHKQERLDSSPERREKERQRQRDARKADPQKARDRVKRSYQKHAEQRRKDRVDYRERNLEKERERDREYAKSHPERSRQQRGVRRARIYAARTEPVNYSKILERDGLVCHLCGKDVKREDVHFDHVIPLSKGGSHSYENVKVSHASCNQKKGNRQY